MTTTRTFPSLTQTLIERAAVALQERRHVVAEQWREKATGLLLKFNDDSASYFFAGRAHTIKLGELRRLDDDPNDATLITLEIAKHLAREVRAAIKQDRDPKAYVRTYRDRLILGRASKADAHIAATHASAASGGPAYSGDGPWTWARCVDQFLKRKLPNLKGRHVKQYERYLRHPAFAPIADKRLPELRHVDLHLVQKTLTPGAGGDEDGKANSTTMRCMSQAAAMLDWAKAQRPLESGLAYVDHPWWRQIKVDYRSKPRRRAPEPDELARTLVLIEIERASTEDPLAVTPSVLAALTFAIATAQRDGAMVQLLRNNIMPHPTEAGWKVAHWTADQMKTGLPHAVPIAPYVVAMLEAFWAEIDGADPAAPRSAWAFPSRRGDGHVNASALNQLFDRLRGKTPKPSYALVAAYKGKPGPKPKDRSLGRADLFARYGVEDWTIHDGRRSLTNELANAGLGAAASAILAHKTALHLPRSQETPLEMMARTTSRHYFTAQQIPLKTLGMKLWTDLLLKAIEHECLHYGIDQQRRIAYTAQGAQNARYAEPNQDARSRLG